MAAPPRYDDYGKQVAPAQYDPPPVNKTKMHVKCRRGNIENLLEVGLSSWDSRCPSTSLDDTSNQRKLLEVISADPVCSYRNSPGDANYTQAIVDHFRSISGKSSNYFELNLNTMFSKECYDKILGLNYLQKRLPNFSWKPEIYILVQCLEDGFFNPMTFRNDLTRRNLLHLVLVADCAMVFCFMISVIFLEKMSKRAITEFKDFNNSLETRDFAVQVSGLPKIKDYKHEQILKAMLFQHFEDLVSVQPQQIKCLQRSQRYENQIVDVFFAKQNYGPMRKLVEIKDLHRRIAYLDTYQKNTESDQSKNIMRIEKKIEKLKAKFIVAQNKHFETGRRLEEFKRSVNHDRADNVQMAYVLFRSMEGRARALCAYR